MRTLLLAVAAVVSSLFSPLAKAESPKLVVAILVDQLRYDYLERYSEHFTNNGFRTFLDQGAFMTFARYNYYPTKTAPGHASFLSGGTPSMHGIIGNEWFDKQTRKQVYCVEDPSVTGVGTAGAGGKMSPRNYAGGTFADEMRLRFGSKVVGISMKDRGAVLPAGKKPAGAYWFESKSGNFVTSTYYMQELPAWVKTFNDRKRAADFIGKTWSRLIDPKFYRFDDAGAGEGSLAGEKKSTFDHVVAASASDGFENIMPTPFGNQLLGEFAVAAIEGEKLGQGAQPDLLCVSFSSIDYVGHKFGPYSHEVQDMTLRLDRQLAELFNYLDKKIGLSNVVMTLTADHGVAPNPDFAAKEGLGGEVVNESTQVLDLMTKLDERFGAGKYLLSPKAWDGNLYLNHDTLKEKKIAVGEITGFIRDWAMANGKFQACYSSGQLLEGRAPGMIGQMVLNGYSPERSGDVILITKPYLVATAKTGTSHGSPYSYDTHIPVLFYGKGFNPGRYADEFYITDIVPTLCAVLRMDVPAGCIGKPLVKVLRQP